MKAYTFNPISTLLPTLGLALLITLSACSKADVGTRSTFLSAVEQGGELDVPETSLTVINETTSFEIIDDELWNCTTTTYDALAGAGMDAEGYPLYNPNASVIYPGSLLQGESLNKATPDIIPLKRSGGTVSYNLINGNLQSFFEVEEVLKSSIQNAMNNIIANSPSDLPANFTFNYEQVQSREALALSLGVDFENAFVDISADFDFSSDNSYNRILVKMKQNFYTMSFDIPSNLSEVFHPSVTAEDLERFVQAGNPATFISDVTYGRVYYMLLESTSSYTEMSAAVDAEFTSVKGEASIDFDGSYMNSLDDLRIKVMAFGGESGSTIKTITGDLNELVDLLAESSTIQTGLPLSYVVRSVHTGQVVGVQLATQYDVTECTPSESSDNAPIFLAHWKGNVLNTLGPVGAAYSENGGTNFVLISQDGKQFMRSSDLSLDGPYPIEDLFEGEYPFGDEGIAAASRHATLPKYFFVSTSGLYVTGMHPLWTGTVWSTEEPEWGNRLTWEDITWQCNGSPFPLNGIGALLEYYSDEAEQVPFSMWAYNNDGDRFAQFETYWCGAWHGEIMDITNWGNSTLPLQKVGAGVGFRVNNEGTASQQKQYIMFNHTGTQYYISGAHNSFGGDGPYDL